MKLDDTILRNEKLDDEEREALEKIKTMYEDAIQVAFGTMPRIEFRDKYELSNGEMIDYIVELRRDFDHLNTHILYIKEGIFNNEINPNLKILNLPCFGHLEKIMDSFIIPGKEPCNDTVELARKNAYCLDCLIYKTIHCNPDFIIDMYNMIKIGSETLPMVEVSSTHLYEDL